MNELPFKTYRGLPPIAENESALFESAQGIMLDVDYGCYPFVTSASVFPSSLHKIEKRVGVMKAYTSRVGDGPPNFPDLPWLSEKGSEIGTTTGRKRKCYWLIKNDIDYALSVFKPDEIVVTKLDILQDVDIKVWDNSKELSIGNLDSYKDYLLETFPMIKHFSESPDGDLINL
jgi:adenylosuccinate synthase